MMRHGWRSQHRTFHQGTTMAVVGTLLLSSCAAAPFLIPVAFEFAKNLLQTGLQNYGSKHRDNLSNLVNRMASPYMQNLPPMAGGRPGMPQQQYPGQQTYPGQAGTYDPNNPYGTGAQNSYGQPISPYGTTPGYAGQPGMPQQQYPGQQTYPGQAGAYDPNNPYGTGGQNSYGQPTSPYGTTPGYAGQPGMPQQQYPGQQTYPGQAGTYDPNNPYGTGGQNPYGTSGYQTQPGQANPYGSTNQQYGSQNPYGTQSPYGSPGYPASPGQANPYGGASQYPPQPGQVNPYGAGTTAQGYGQTQPGYGQSQPGYGTGTPSPYGTPQQPPQQTYGGYGTASQPYGVQSYGGGGIYSRAVPSEPVAVDVAMVRQKQTAKGKKAVLMNDGEVLHDGGGTKDAGDKFKLVVRTNCDCYVYIVSLDGSAWAEVVFPTKAGTMPNPVKKDQEVAFPEGPYWFSLDQVKGIETFYVVASANRQTDLEEYMAKVAAETRPVSTIVAKVEEPAVIPRGVGSTKTRGIITVKDEGGGATQVTPLSYMASLPGQDVTVTRWFKHE